MILEELAVAGKSTSSKKDTKAKDKKPRRSQKGIAKWWRETAGELRKVTWPTPKEALALTKVVVIVIFAMSAFLGLFDFLFSRLLALILS
jgi:preprotein translocase subunit SecE